jgi:hypothetical protein
MKCLKTIAFCMLVFAFKTASAQNQNERVPELKAPPQKPALFSNYSSKINCKPAEIKKFLSLEEGDKTDLSISDNLTLAGTVFSVVDDGKIRTIQMQVSNFSNAVFSLSRTLLRDKTYSYIGMLMSYEHGDMYMLKYENNKFLLEKQEKNNVIMD